MKEFLKKYWYVWSLLLLVGLMFFWRQNHINQVPYIDDPFDVQAYKDDLRERLQEGNAYEDYYEAWKVYTPLPYGLREVDRYILNWETLDSEANAALLANQETLAHWRRGVEKPWRQNNSVIMWLIDGEKKLLPHVWSSVRSPDLLLLSLLEARRLVDKDKTEQAWRHQLAGIKYIFQPEIGDVQFEQPFMGLRVLKKSMEFFLAEDRISAELLLQIDQEISNLPDRSSTVSDEVKGAYLSCEDGYSERGKLLPREISRLKESWYREMMMEAWTGKGEMRFRRYRLACQNVLRFCDLPIEEQPPRVVCDWWMQIYDTQGIDAELGVTSQEFLALSKKTGQHYGMLMLERELTFRQLKKSFREGSLLLTVIQRFHRDRGAFPVTLKELVPEYIAELPPDRFTPGKPLKYRRFNGHAQFWSVGPDQLDDDGNLEFKESGSTGVGPGDIVFHAWRPGTDFSLLYEQEQVGKSEQRVEDEENER